MNIIHCEQGTLEWFEARKGIPTASKFATVMAVGVKGGKSITRVDYLNKLAGEILTGEPMANYSNEDMERGKAQEDEARLLYAFMQDVDPERVGFIVNHGAGCSPDSLLPGLGGLEIKSAAPHIQIARLLKGELPSEHKAQIQGSMWVAERLWWDFVSYCPGLPLFVLRVERDEEYIKKIAKEVELFNVELRQTVDYIRKLSKQKEAA